MDGFVARQNIEHCREMLKTTTDPAQRRVIEKNCFSNKKPSSRNTKKIISRNNSSR